MNSMTGFGRSSVEDGGYTITSEIRSVNHRFCEIQVRMPRQLSTLEDKIKRCISQYIKRGKVDVWISVDGEIGIERELSVDWSLLDQYVSALKEMNDRYGSDDSVRYNDLLALPDIVSVHEKEQMTEEFAQQILSSIEKAVINLYAMRKEEGRHLYDDVIKRLSTIDSIINDVIKHAPLVQKFYEERLSKRIKELNDELVQADESRILTEVAVYADKSNIEEELTRLRSHVHQFKTILNEDESIGRKLDFLVQEMNRESNTIGSKANDYTISKRVVELKSEIEKIKEQVQNIE